MSKWLRKANDPNAVRIPAYKLTKEQQSYITQNFAAGIDLDGDTGELIIRFAPELRSALDQYLRDNGIYSTPDVQ